MATNPQKISFLGGPAHFVTYGGDGDGLVGNNSAQFLRVLWFSIFRPEVISSTGKPEVTSPFDSSTHVYLSGLLTSFVYPFRSKVIQHYRLGFKFPLAVKFSAFWKF
jgi:hypothetical protein